MPKRPLCLAPSLSPSTSISLFHCPCKVVCIFSLKGGGGGWLKDSTRAWENNNNNNNNNNNKNEHYLCVKAWPTLGLTRKAHIVGAIIHFVLARADPEKASHNGR